MSTFAVDFDMTLHNPSDRKPGYKMGQPILGAVEAMQALHKAIAKWLTYFDIPYHRITNIKPDATAYIDDRAIRFENNWPEITEQLCGRT